MKYYVEDKLAYRLQVYELVREKNVGASGVSAAHV